MKKDYRIAGIGELLWDIFPNGKKMGGAPLNFVYHITKHDCEGIIISAVGNDSAGSEIIEEIRSLNISTEYIQLNNFPTGVAQIQMDEEGLPMYNIKEPVAWDFIKFNPKIEPLTSTIDAVCWGTLAQRNTISQDTIRNFLSNLRPDCLKVFDANLRQNYYCKEMIAESLGLCNILKINEEELPIIGKLLGLEGKEDSLLSELLLRFNIDCIAYAKGENGSTLITRKSTSFLESSLVKVVDTVGAGDAFTAALVVYWLQKQNLAQTHANANSLAAYICAQHGATPFYEITKNIIYR